MLQPSWAVHGSLDSLSLGMSHICALYLLAGCTKVPILLELLPFPSTACLQDVTERMNVDMAAACKAINEAGRMHVRTIHGTKDKTILVKDAHMFAEAIRGSELVLVEGGDHNYTAADKRQELVDAVVEFLVRDK